MKHRITIGESMPPNSDSSGLDAHWVTIDRHHVLIHEASNQRPSTPGKIKVFVGEATYYNLPGSRTASGQHFDRSKMAGAMTAEKAALGQTAIVTYKTKDANGHTITRSVSVIVNDRGPFARNAGGIPLRPLTPDPRVVIDLTPAVFKQLTGSLRAGRVHVVVVVPAH